MPFGGRGRGSSEVRAIVPDNVASLTYDLVVPESTYTDLRFQTLLEVIRSPEFKEAATALGGNDLKDCGKIVRVQ